MNKPIKIIDLFAGPGGLGEGFSSLSIDGFRPFKTAISIEKEASAHRTLTLRSFFRQFPDGAPEEYYHFLKGELGKTPEEQLYKIEEFKDQVEAANKEAQKLTLGEQNPEIYKKIRKAISADEDCILIGGPPCQAYSLAGQARNKGNTQYNANDDHRNFLYKEYLKVLARFQPKIFVMENVKGMLSAKVDGKPIFESIRKDLLDPCKAVSTKPEKGREKHQYKIYSLAQPNDSDDLFDEIRNAKDFIIRSEEHSVPQKRHRVIILGIRDDLDIAPEDIPTLPRGEQPVSIKDVIDDLPKLRSGLSKEENSAENWERKIKEFNGQALKELKKLDLSEIAEEIVRSTNKCKSPKIGQGKVFGLRSSKALTISKNKEIQSWFYDKRMQGYTTNHETRGHIVSDLHRYMFSSCWAKIAHIKNWDIKFPKSSHYPEALKPNHKNFNSGKFTDRFRCQVSTEPATTITSHISKDGHYFIHYDPQQCRSLTVREAARVQTFPDNYFFVGNRTEQYVQVGNAVPPYLARQIAEIVNKIIGQ